MNVSYCNCDELKNDSDYDIDTASLVVEMIEWEKKRITEEGEKIRKLAGKIRKA